MQRMGFQKGDTIVSMGFTSGLAYILDARMELTAFYLPDIWGDHYNCFCLKTIKSKPRFLILPTDQVIKYDQCMKGSTRELSIAYTYVDSIFNPYANSYYRNKDAYLRIYKSKE